MRLLLCGGKTNEHAIRRPWCRIDQLADPSAVAVDVLLKQPKRRNLRHVLRLGRARQEAGSNVAAPEHVPTAVFEVQAQFSRQGFRARAGSAGRDREFHTCIRHAARHFDGVGDLYVGWNVELVPIGMQWIVTAAARENGARYDGHMQSATFRSHATQRRRS